MVLEKTLEIPWTARRSNPSILKEISPDYSSEGLMLKLKLQYFGHLMWRTDSFEKTLILGKIEGRRRRGRQRMRCLDGITDSMDMGLSKPWELAMVSLTPWTWVWVSSGRWWRTGKPGVLPSVGPQRVEEDWESEQPQIRNSGRLRTTFDVSTTWRTPSLGGVPGFLSLVRCETESQPTTHLLSDLEPWLHVFLVSLSSFARWRD